MPECVSRLVPQQSDMVTSQSKATILASIREMQGSDMSGADLEESSHKKALLWNTQRSSNEHSLGPYRDILSPTV